MSLTQEQATSLINKARQRKPDLSREEAKQILALANQQVISSTQQAKPEDTRTGAQQASDFVGLGTTARNISTIMEFGDQASRTAGAGEASGDAFARSNELIQQAKMESDPAKKKALVDQARSIMRGSETQMDNFTTDLARRQNNAGISEKDMERGSGQFALRRGLGQSAELASWLLPSATTGARVFTKGSGAVGSALFPKLSTPLARIGQASTRSALAGGLQGLAGASRDADTLGEGLLQTATGAVVGAGVGAAFQTGIEGVKLAIQVPQKAGKWVKNKVTNQAKDDVVNQLKPNKTIREAAYKRNIDIGDEFYKNYTDDIVKNVDISNRQIQQASTKLENVLKNNQSQFDGNKIVDEIVQKQIKNARTSAEREALVKWAEFTKQRMVEKYGSTTINSTAALVEKKLAGQSGYKVTSDVVDGFIGKADANLERSLRKQILNSVSGAEKLRIEKLLRQQEVGIFMGNIMEEALYNKLPRSTAQKIGSLFFPSSLVRETIGTVGQQGVAGVAGATNPTTNVLNFLAKPVTKTTGVIQSAIQKPETYVNPSISALQRMIEKENQAKQTNKLLP